MSSGSFRSQGTSLPYTWEKNEMFSRYRPVIICGALGGMIIFFQRLLFARGLIPTGSLSRADYVEEIFTPAAGIVLLVSVVFAGIWCWRTGKLFPTFVLISHKESVRAQWGMILLFLLLGIVVALLLGRPEAMLWLGVFLVIDCVVIYWLATAYSTPNLMVPTVPVGSWLRPIRR